MILVNIAAVPKWSAHALLRAFHTNVIIMMQGMDELLKEEFTLEETVSSTDSKVPIRLWTMVYSVLTVCLLSLLAGVTLAFPSPVLVELLQLDDPQFRFDTQLADIFGAAAPVGGLFGGLIAGWFADKLGRKTTIILTSVPYLSGYFIILCAVLAENGIIFKVVLMVGRFLTGVGMGWTFAIMGVYIGEISPSRSRGVFASMTEVTISLGILLILALGAIPNTHYYHLALVIVGIVTLFVILGIWIPETPRWLLLKSKNEKEATAVLKYLRGPKYRKVQQEVNEIKSSFTKKSPTFFNTIRQLLCNRNMLIPFLLVLYILIYQQACGKGPLTNFIGPIFSDIGVPSPNLTAAFSLGGVSLLVTIIGVIAIDFVGRKLLLALSSSGMFLASSMMSVQFYLTQPSYCNNSTVLETADLVVDCNLHLYPLAIAGVILFSLSFSIGVGPVPWVIVSEYIPFNVRSMAAGIMSAISWGMAAISSGTFLNLSEAIGAWGIWLLLASYHALSFLIIVLFFIETKGKKLEEVQEMFAARFQCQTCSKKH